MFALAQRIRRAFDDQAPTEEQLDGLCEAIDIVLSDECPEITFDSSDNEALGQLSGRVERLVGNASRAISHQKAQGARLAAIDNTLALVEVELDGTVTHANTNFLKLLREDRSPLGQNFMELLDEVSMEDWRSGLKQVAQTECVSTELQLMNGNRQPTWVSASLTAVRDDDEQPTRAMVTFNDLTELRDSSQQASQAWTMLEHAPANLMFADVDGIIGFANTACRRELQSISRAKTSESDSVVGQSINRIHPSLSSVDLSNQNHPREYELECNDETILLTSTPVLDNEKQFIGSLLSWEIAKEQQAEASEIARLSSMVDQAPVNIMFADRDLIVRYMNSASHAALKKIQQHVRVDPDTLIGQSIEVFAKDKQRQRQILADPANLPVRMQRTLGPETVDLLISPLFDDQHNYLGAMLTWELITERIAREQEEAQREQESREQSQAEALETKAQVILGLVSSLANGQFDLDFPDLGDDAIGKIATALSRAVRSVRDTLSEVRDGASTVAIASTEMSKASEEISRGAQQQAERLDETASSLEEITTTVKQNSENAQEARALANGSRDVATEGGKVVGSAVQAMSEINEASKKIGEIITTIDEIAFQTNLLALNAAVEAARAGEQGRGFAVVAAEVRNLAQRSASSAKEIKALIQDSNSKVEKGTKLVNMSGETLGDIVDSVKRVTDIVVEIAAASESQLAGIERVNSAMNQMDRVTQTNANQTEELAGTSNSVLNTAQQLDEMVSQFQLGKTSR